MGFEKSACFDFRIRLAELKGIKLKKNNCYLLTHAIKKTLAIGVSGLLVTFSNAWAGADINPNEIWVGLSHAEKICAFDFDQDGDIDIVHYHGQAVTLQENIGSLSAPLFVPKKVITSAPHAFQVQALNNPSQSCALKYHGGSISVDIDNDGDLDSFSTASVADGEFISSLAFYEQTEAGLQKSDNTLGLPAPTSLGEPEMLLNLGFVDIDSDGDIDVFGNDGEFFYENAGTPQNAIFVKREKSPLSCENEPVGAGMIIDLNGDHQVDRVCKDNTVMLSSSDGYTKTSGLFQGPAVVEVDDLFYKIYNTRRLDLNQDGFKEIEVRFSPSTSFVQQIRDMERGEPLFNSYPVKKANAALVQCGLKTDGNWPFYSLGFHDFEGDNAVDFFAISNDDSARVVYCKNNGSTDSPVYLSAVETPSLKDVGLGISPFVMGDIDGDGDADLHISHPQHKFYDNIGTSENPVFKHISHTPFTFRSDWLDIDGDSRVDSIFQNDSNPRLLYKGLESAIGISAETNGPEHLIIAINRPSQVQLYRCHIDGRCDKPAVLPNIAKEIAVSVGDFTHTSDGDEIALTMVDENGLINLNIYDKSLNLINQGQGGVAQSIAMSSGQLDSDPEDEVALSFVQADGTVLAAAINFDMSIIGLTQQGLGKSPSIAVGNFADTLGAYALSYITLDNQLKTATYQGNGTLINQGDGGAASDAKISKASLLSDTPSDEYVISTLQSNGVVGLVRFSSNGDVLSQVSGGLAQQPMVISRYSPSSTNSSKKENRGLVASIIQADKKPAVIFLDNQGNYLAIGIGGKAAVVATLVNGGDDQTTLVYIDDNGIPRWETFGADGVKR